MIKAKKIHKNYGTVNVLSNVSFSLEKGQKVALVGYNGTGKTTLLKILAGIEDCDSGNIDVAKNICIGYLPQDTSLCGDESIINYLRSVSGIDSLEKEMKTMSVDLSSAEKIECYDDVCDKYKHLGGYSFTHKVEIMLSGFGLENIELSRPLSCLSSGQKSKIVLLGILLKGVDLLLLDEPTNNLDLPALIWLEDFLQKTEALCVVVSHDRKFLDKVVNKIFEIDYSTHTLTVTGGTYSNYLEMVSKRNSGQKEKYRLQQEEINRLNNLVQEKRASSNKGSVWKPNDNDKHLRGFKRDRAGKSSKTSGVIERRMMRMNVVEKPVERKVFEILIPDKVCYGSLDVRLTDVVVGYKDTFNVGPLSFEICYGNRVGIMGLNGTGKSTLLRTITGRIEPLSGRVEIGSGVVIGNMMQEHETLPREKTPLEFLSEKANINTQDSYAKLSKFGISERQVKLPINTLSPGVRARLLLALFSAQAVNMLVLDEPTNHLDIEALEALEESLKTYRGTILLVSHDRCFLDKASLNVAYVLSDGVLTRIPDYKEYVELAEKKAQKLLKLL